MPKFKKRAFVNDEDDEPEPEPELKRSKKATVEKATKASGKAAATGLTSGVDGEGNAYWNLANLRRVGVSEFRGNTMINIREYYDADGEKKPGKKGISLTMPQFQNLVAAIPFLVEDLRERGIDIELPSLAKKAGEGDDGGDDEEQPAASKKQLAPAKPRKANHEATSDEDSE